MSVEKLIKRKRAVSPVIAAILLIGLTVAAGAIVYFMVFSETDKADAKITAVDVSSTKVSVTVFNSGAKDDAITEVTIVLPATAAVTDFTYGTTNGTSADGFTWTWTLDYAVGSNDDVKLEFTKTGLQFGDPGSSLEVTVAFEDSDDSTQSAAI